MVDVLCHVSRPPRAPCCRPLTYTSTHYVVGWSGQGSPLYRRHHAAAAAAGGAAAGCSHFAPARRSADLLAPGNRTDAAGSIVLLCDGPARVMRSSQPSLTAALTAPCEHGDGALKAEARTQAAPAPLLLSTWFLLRLAAQKPAPLALQRFRARSSAAQPSGTRKGLPVAVARRRRGAPGGSRAAAGPRGVHAARHP